MLRFDQYMHQCLYGPGGFYATTGRAGQRRGDFITSPEVGPLFGDVVANAIDGWWVELGEPDDFTVFDVGCGPGAFLRSIQRARPDRPWNLVGVDAAAASLTATESGDDRSKRKIRLLAELPNQLEGSVVLGNELLDNIPFRILEKSAEGLSEVHVELSSQRTPNGETLSATEVLVSVSPQEEDLLGSGGPDGGLNFSLSAMPPGARFPLLTGAADWVRSTLERNPARLCLLDYATMTTAELARRGGWLRTYAQHERGNDPYERPGNRDITTDVAIDQLEEPVTVSTQAEFLQRWGIAELVEEGRENWKANAHAPNVAALKMRSRISESEALLNPEGLGSWKVLEWT